MDDAVGMLRDVARAVAAKVPQNIRGEDGGRGAIPISRMRTSISRSASASPQKTAKRVVLPGAVELSMTELPAVESLATVVRSGPNYQSHLGFGALGLWMAANRCRIAGPSREVFLEPPFQTPEQEDAVVEIQFPVTAAA